MNIIGEGFPNVINNQVKKRQEVYGSGYGPTPRSPEEIVYLNANTSWVKLVSSVNVDNQTILLNKSLSTIPGIGDNKLAEKFVLFNGVNEDPSNQRYGISLDGSSLGNNNAYGIGGTEFGLRPMMGIKRAEIKHENRGSLRRASIQIKAFNRVQFDIIDVLYLRLGFNILLEWGHSMYYDDKGVLQTNPNDSLSNDFLKGKIPYNKFLTKISNQKLKSCGNYDAMFAKITNFHWSFLPDGSYDITIDLVSIGDVVESFKINSLIDDRPGAPNAGIDSLEEAIKLINKSTIGRFLYALGKKVLTSSTKSAISDDISTLKVDAVCANYDNGVGNLPYIRLGTLLQFFQEKMMYKFVVGDDVSPILNFDYETDSNIMFIENDFQVSTDPRICLVNRIINIEGKEYSPFIPYGEPFESPLFDTEVQYGQIMNIYVNMYFILIKMEELKTADSNKVILIDFLNNILSSISNSLGGINKLEATLDETTNTVIIRDANPLPNIEKVIATLNAVAGKKYNIPDKYTTFDLYGYNKEGNGAHASFIKDFSFKTEITPELSTMLTVGATANSKVVGENSTALSKFNAGLTDRFKEQIVQSKEDVNSNLQEFYDKLSESQELYNKFKTLLKDYTNYLIGLSQGKFNPSDAETYKDALTNYLTYYQQYRQAQYQINYAIKYKKRPPPLFAPNTGFIPFNLSLTMDGLSGMKIYSKFLIDVDFLPSNYPENADFLIKNIHHVIENNKWFTTLESIVISQGGTDPSMFGKNKLSPIQSQLLPPPLPNISPSSNKVGSGGYSSSPLARYIASQGYKNARLPDNPSLLVVINDNIQKYQQVFKLHPSAAKAYSQWAKAAKSAGFNWTVSSAYRDFAKQSSLGKAKTVASPGSSPHGWGGALDFSELFRAVGGSGSPSVNSNARQTNTLYKWMAENGPKFGWYNPYRLADGSGTDEIWHWEYWGNV
jgi:hypothetical protein